MTLTHVDENGQPRMVDVGNKATTSRSATARSVVALPDAVAAAFNAGELVTKKGPVVQTAIIAGTLAVKKTSELIPFCHPLQIRGCDFSVRLDGARLIIDCTVKVDDKTGVEMEALTGVSVAALTVYDMLKALSHDIRIIETALQAKSGGKSDFSREARS